MNRTVASLGAVLFLTLAQIVSAADGEVGREILRLLPEWPGASVEIPLDVYRKYHEALVAPAVDGPLFPPPVSHIVETGTYRFEIKGDQVQLRARIILNVLRPADCRNLRLLTNKVAWKEIQIDGKPAPAPAIYLKNGWLRFTPPGAGVFTISASADLKATRRGALRNVKLPPVASARLLAGADSDEV